MRPKKAIIIAAGMGRRLAPYTDHMPKCLVPIRGEPMLVRQLRAFRVHGLDEFVIIRGYKAEVLEARRAELGPGVRFVENREFATNNILQSLFTAADELDGPVVTTYADIVFADDVVGALLAPADGPSRLVVDLDFAKIYEGRDQHPLAEAEVCATDGQGRVTAVGKRALPPERATGEFIGLGRWNADAVRALQAARAELTRSYAGRETAAFGRNTWRGAYLTDLIEHLMAQGVAFSSVPIRGRWREIDTVQDLERAEATVDW